MTNFITNFKNGIAYLDISGSIEDQNEYLVEFIDINTNIVEYKNTIKINHWAKLENVLEKNITIRVTSDNKIIFERNKNQKFNRVYILFGSHSLGDNIAWIPYVEEYRKLNNIEVIVCTYYNYLFDKVYPELIFTDISDCGKINDVDKKFRIDHGPALYRINGVLSIEQWYISNQKYDNAIDYFDYRKQSLQSMAAITLGLPNIEIVSKVNIPDNKSKINGKYVVVAIQSTSQCKYWNNPFGWERLFSFLERNGYKVVVIDRFKKVSAFGNQAPKGKNVIDKTGNLPLSDRITDIKYADMIITISSGLAWVAWAVGTPVVMISGVTKPWNEFKSNCIRIHNNTVCNGCWNDTNITYDADNWLFCPKKQNFICSKAIQPKDVIDAIKPLMK